MRDPLDPFSKVLNEQSRWDPEWYAWLQDLAKSTTRLETAVPPTTDLTPITAQITVLQAQVAALQAAPPPGMTFIRRQAVTTPVTAIDFTGLTAAYDVYVLEGAGLSVNQDGAGIFLRASLNNGATFDTSGVYYSDMIYHYWNGDTGVAYATSPTATIYQQITHGQGGPSLVALPFDFTLRVYGCGVGERYATFQSYATNYHNTVNGPMSLLSAGWYLGGGGVNAIRLFNHLGGSIVSGSVTMYGMRKT